MDSGWAVPEGATGPSEIEKKEDTFSTETEYR
jgi:hypothetical protein